MYCLQRTSIISNVLCWYHLPRFDLWVNSLLLFASYILDSVKFCDNKRLTQIPRLLALGSLNPCKIVTVESPETYET